MYDKYCRNKCVFLIKLSVSLKNENDTKVFEKLKNKNVLLLKKVLI